MFYSLQRAHQDDAQAFKHRDFHGDVYALILWETVDPKHPRDTANLAYIDFKKPLSPEQHEHVQRLLAITPCTSWPIQQDFLTLLPYPGVCSSWAVNTL